jgi:hypothetical protein
MTTTPWQEVRALAEKWREDASHADEAAAATDNLLLDAEIYGAAVAKRACADELDALLRDPAFIGMMEDAARYRVLRNRTGDGWMSADAPQGESLDRLLDAEIWRINLAARASSAGEGE